MCEPCQLFTAARASRVLSEASPVQAQHTTQTQLAAEASTEARQMGLNQSGYRVNYHVANQAVRMPGPGPPGGGVVSGIGGLRQLPPRSTWKSKLKLN